MAKEAQKLIANNKKVFHDYFVEETYEAGLVLHGTEVKSLRQGKCSVRRVILIGRQQAADLIVELLRGRNYQHTIAFLSEQHVCHSFL